MDFQETNEGNRSADGLYYGITILYLMNTFIGIAAVILGAVSIKNVTRPRNAYYHYLATYYTLFCSIMAISVALYLLKRQATPDGDPMTGTKWILIAVTAVSGTMQLAALSHSRMWQRAVFSHQLQRISTTPTTTTIELKDQEPPLTSTCNTSTSRYFHTV